VGNLAEGRKFRVPRGFPVAGFRLPVSGFQFLVSGFWEKPYYSVGRALSARPAWPSMDIHIFSWSAGEDK
jgi:hypothetical protein